MAMGKLARGGMMGRLRKRMNEPDRNAMADKFGNQFREQMAQAGAGQNVQRGGGNMADQTRQAMQPVMGAGQAAERGGQLRQGQSADVLGHAEPDADDRGGPSDNDADDLAAPPPRRRPMDRMRGFRGGR